MRLLLIEESADGLLDLAIRAKALGHDVRYHVGSYDPVKHPTGKGLVERVADWRAAPNWPDLVVAGGNGKYVRDLDLLRARGVPVIGANAEAVKLELDRTAGMAAFKKAGIPTPPFRQCRTLDEAIEYVTKQDRPFACKPCGATSDKSLSFVGKTPEDTIWRLQRWKRSGKRFPDGLMIQERIKGIEFAAGAWFGRPGGFVEGIEENFETKRFLAGDLGPNTGEMGTVTRLVRTSKLFDQVLAPVESQLSRLGYVGNIDVNCIVDEDGTPYPLEWTVRLGWPAFNIELALHKSDPVEFLACVASGEKPPARTLNEVAVGVVLAIPPYPFGHERPEEIVNVPMWGVTPGIEGQLHFCDVMRGDAPRVAGGGIERDGQLATAGSYVLVATGTGDTVASARGKAHRVLDRLSIPASPFWRNDIGLRLKRQLPELQRHGYAKGLAYS